jgi:AraC-like DNA-binding protein
MKVTLQEYVARKKIEHSLDLIKTGNYSITEIALMLHYESVQSFGKAFKKIMGSTPSEFRKKQKNN